MTIFKTPFDQFQRYYTVSKLVEKLNDKQEKVSVLEVGANGHFKLLDFLPNANITFSDIEKHPVPDHIQFIQADATNLPFEDGEFDFVVSTDVLEHVPSQLRSSFILECRRVSNIAFILACPVDNGSTPDIEKVANETFKNLHGGIDYRWLKEHEDEGLPKISEINSILEQNNVPYVRFEHGRLDHWQSLMQMHFIKEAEPAFKNICSNMDEYYNKYIYQQDIGGNCYRSFWIINTNELNVENCLYDNLSQNQADLLRLYGDICHVSEELVRSDQLNHQELENLKKDLTESKALLEHVSQERDLLLSSTSWKVTRPMRAIAYLLKGDKRQFKVGLLSRWPWLRVFFKTHQTSFLKRFKFLVSILIHEGPTATVQRLKMALLYTGDAFDNQNITYSEWLERNKYRETKEQKKILKLLDAAKFKPLISVVMPTYNTDEKYLRFCIESVINQSYVNWEFCIADDASTQEHVVRVIREYQESDSRIKLTIREQNGHISAATNSAIELAMGDWIALLDHDDELDQNALAYVAYNIITNPNVEFIYTDEDKIDLDGNRTDPYFKCDWNPDLLYSQNYISHLGVYKTDLVKKIDGFRVGYEGSQDYDLLLRYSKEIDQSNIIHISKVLYHWRIIPGSTALSSNEKSYTTEAGVKALSDFFGHINKDISVEPGLVNNTYKVNWPVSTNHNDEPLVSLIIPTYNGYEITKQAIDSILVKTSYSNYEILLVDNNSDDKRALDYFDSIDGCKNMKVLRYPYPFNYSAINNFAVKHANGDIIGLINNDIEVINAEWLTEMVSHCMREDIGCVGAKLYYSNDTIQHAGVIMGIGGVAGHSHKYFPRTHPGYFSRLLLTQNYSAVTAACLLVRKSVFEEVNGLDEENLPIAFNDVDFCLKVQKSGYRNLWTPYAELYHHESISRGAEDSPEKLARFNKEVDYMLATWNIGQKTDFSYNKNLTPESENFGLTRM